MSGIGQPAPPQRRVREDFRDGVAVMAFSAAASLALTFALVLLSGLAK